jgi:hypothetical protein
MVICSGWWGSEWQWLVALERAGSEDHNGGGLSVVVLFLSEVRRFEKSVVENFKICI